MSVTRRAVAIGLVLAGAARLSIAGQTCPEAARFESPRRPKVEFVAGGDRVFRVVPPDAIEAIDRPDMIPAIEAAGLMREDEPVVGVFDGDHARAYPTWFLDSHEVINDLLGDTPIAATWCPLANTGVVYVRVIDGKETTFGVSGALWRDSPHRPRHVVVQSLLDLILSVLSPKLTIRPAMR